MKLPQGVDSLDNLPVPKNVNYTDDEKGIHSLFRGASNDSNSYDSNNKTTVLILLGVLFLVLTLPQFDDFIEKIPYCDTPYIRLVVKCIIFVGSVFVMQKFY